ncbi:MAG: hypothetical protein JKY71_02895 [Alphaproteobacteria bacterium]|nr:hypothetical protein [Alphaproteobacteria bacterium]
MNEEELDTLILGVMDEEWTKIAVIISKVYDAVDEAHQTKALGQEIAQRIYILVDNGALECQGNMRRWRDADIRLPS